MSNKLWAGMSLFAVASLILAACAPAAVPTPQTIVQTQIVAGTPVEVVVTATPPPPKAFAAKDPTTFVYAKFGEAETLDPALDYETAGAEILQSVYETLVFYNKENTNDFVPQLATEWKVSADSKTYTFTIRKGVKFHNGDELTPEDVAYSFQRGLLQGGTASPQFLLVEPFFGIGMDDISLLVDPEGGLYDDAEKMKAADPAKLKAACEQVKSTIVADNAAGTVTMTLAQPWGPFLATIAQTWGSAMDKKWVVENKGWDGSCDTWQNFYAVTSENDPFTPIANGTGPFKLDHWTPGQETVLVRNDAYWRTDAAWEGGPTGQSKLGRVVFKKVDEWGTRLAMLQAGDADTADVNRVDVAQADPLVGEICKWNNDKGAFDPCEVKSDAPLRLWIGFPQVSRTDVFLNFKINVPEGGNPLVGSGQLDGNGIPSDFFADEHVRKAFNYCFDWDTYIKDALVGEAVQTTSIAIPAMIGYDAKDPHYTFDAKKCEEEFKASTLKSKDGKSLWDIGFRMQIAYNTGNTVRQTVAEILASDLASVNDKFQVEVIGLPWPTFLRNQRAKTLPLFISGWLEDIHDPHNWYVPYLTGTYGRRQSLPDDFKAEIQPLINQGVSETDPVKRAAIYKQINEKVYGLAPDILLAVPTGRRYEQRWVEGWYYNPIYVGNPSGNYYYPLSKK